MFREFFDADVEVILFSEDDIVTASTDSDIGHNSESTTNNSDVTASIGGDGTVTHN